MNTSFASAECGNVWNIVMSVYKARTCQCCFASVQKISCCWSVFRHNHQVIYAKARAFLLVSNQNNVRREKQHNSQSLWNKGNGLNKSFTSTSPPLVLYIHTSKLYKNTALLGPNVYLVGVPKVALRPQLEQIGYICGLCRSADISSSFRDLWDVCWEIKQIHRKAGVTMLCWNWPEVCPHLSVVTLLSCLGCMHSAHKADSQSAFQISVLLTLLLIKKALATADVYCEREKKGSKLHIDLMNWLL